MPNPAFYTWYYLGFLLIYAGSSILYANTRLIEDHILNTLFFQQKQQENEFALRSLPDYLDHLNSLSWEQRQHALVAGLLAGNVFDWGAKEVVKFLESGNGLSFADAQQLLQRKQFL